LSLGEGTPPAGSSDAADEIAGRAGQYRRDVGDDHCEILLGSRVYRVPTRELE
jgi:hypothetical protein